MSSIPPIVQINNAQARALWLDVNGLSTAPTGALDIDAIINKIGFVQIDTIQNVARAHHHILWSRNQNYREADLYHHFVTNRTLFEHFTHDASIIPLDIYPYWSQQFARLGAITKKYKSTQQALKDAPVQDILDRINQEGPLSTHAFQTKSPPKQNRKKGVWHRPPHKRVLDHLWYGGQLTTQRREKFVKFYDLSERVIPTGLSNANITAKDQSHHLNTKALHHLGFGSVKHIQKFWDVYDAAHTKQWCEHSIAKGDIIRAEFQTKNGQYKPCFVPRNFEDLIAQCPTPTSRLRILNPFDPALRDRDRLLDLFGFRYRIEIFTPAAKRQYGYYVYPILQGNRMVGRIDMKAIRAQNSLQINNVWWETGVTASSARTSALDAEIKRMARFIGTPNIQWNTNP